MLVPKRVKHRKVMRSRMKGMAYRGSQFTPWRFWVASSGTGAGLRTLQIEAARVALTSPY